MALPNAFAYTILDERLNLEQVKPSKRKIVELDISFPNTDRNEPFPFQVRKKKWRRLEKLEENAEQQYMATVQTDTSQEKVDGLVGDKSQPEDGTLSQRADLQKPGESELVDPIDDRLNLLQRLVPRGSEVETEEILKVVVDYVKALEREIQTFHDSVLNEPATISSNSGVKGMPSDAMDKPPKPEVNFLQERGLCVVPLSILSEVF